MSSPSVFHSASLSSEQLAVLQTLYVFLESATITLDGLNPAQATDIEVTKTLRDLGLYCKDRMLLAFPDLAVWRALGDGTDGGGQ